MAAKAEVNDNAHLPAYGSAKAVAQAHGVPQYYVPAPATIVSYEQNFELPSQIRYEIPTGGVVAESSAIMDGDSESSVTSVRSDGSGSAESSANTHGVGSFGITSSNSKSFGGQGSASSNAKSTHGVSNIATKSQGFGAASSKSQNERGQVSAQSQSNGGSASSSANNNLGSASANADSQGFGSSSSDVDMNNVQDVVISAAKNIDAKRIHWRFGTAYSNPSGHVHADSKANGGSANSSAQSNGFGSIQSVADAQGQGSAHANGNLNGGYVKSAVENNGNGYGSAKSSINNNGYGVANSVANSNGFGNVKSSANIMGSNYGNVNAHADVDDFGHGSVSSVANGYGSASSIANAGPAYGALRADGFPHYYNPSHLKANAQTSGQGTASSSAKSQGVNTAFRVVNSSANTFGIGSAQANASA